MEFSSLLFKRHRKTPATRHMLCYGRITVVYFIVILNGWFSVKGAMASYTDYIFFKLSDRSVSVRKNDCF